MMVKNYVWKAAVFHKIAISPSLVPGGQRKNGSHMFLPRASALNKTVDILQIYARCVLDGHWISSCNTITHQLAVNTVAKLLRTNAN